PQTEHTTPPPRTGAGRVSTDRFCTGCGKPLVAGVKFCSHCGKAAA
ncbi:MAG: zinc-ribbon domain-containing protein, partial [Hyphomicrobiaceae bacterium]|nr:zinc-ribbon domain-containing protein [Hyphomicrobiaceae bacterium]